jgi:PAS domain S-box-containing protein
MDEGSEDKEALNVDLQTAGSRNNLRGEALHAALEKEETLRTMINNSHVVLFLWKNDDKWPVEFVSENVTKLGYAVEDFTSGRVMYKDFIYSEDLEEVEEEFKKKVKSGASAFSMEYRIITKAGDVRWINERTFIQRNTGGEATHFQGVVLDITRRKKGEEELKKTFKMQEVLTTAVNNSPAVIFLWKNEKYWPAIFVSDNVIKFGYTVDDFISQKIQYGKIRHPDDLKRLEEELDRSIQKGEVSFNSEYRIFTKAGDTLWVNERTFIQRERDGKVACFQGILLDITPRKKVEKALRKSLEMQKMLKTIINKSPSVAFLRKNTEDWPVDFVSENVTQFGYSVEDFLSGNIHYGNIIHREDIQAVVESLARSVREGYDSFEMEYRIFTGDGSIRWVEERTFIQRDSKGEVT